MNPNSHGRSHQSHLYSSNSADSESAGSIIRSATWNESAQAAADEMAERHSLSHTSQSEQETNYYSEVRTVLRPTQEEKRYGSPSRNPFDSPSIDGINAPFIDVAALKQLAHLFTKECQEDATAAQYQDPYMAHLKVPPPPPASAKHYKYTLYSERTGLIRADALLDIADQTLAEFLCKNVFWLDILDPSIEEIRALAEMFRLHQLTLEDMELEANDPEVREKCDVFEDYFYVNLKAIDTELSKGLGPLVPINLALLAFPGMVITTHREPLHFSRTVAKRIRLLTARTGLSADWIVYAILEDVVDFFSVSGRDIEVEVDSIDELVMVLTVNDQEDMLHRIGSIRKRVVQQLRFVSNKTEILRIIVKRASHRFSEDAGFYLRDLHEHVAMLDQNMDQYDESLNRSHNNYLAQVSIEISHTSNKLNDVMKKLTVATSVALPWSLMCGLWGMNIDVPGKDRGQVPFWILFFIMISLSVFTYLLGRHRRWF